LSPIDVAPRHIPHIPFGAIPDMDTFVSVIPEKQGYTKPICTYVRAHTTLQVPPPSPPPPASSKKVSSAPLDTNNYVLSDANGPSTIPYEEDLDLPIAIRKAQRSCA
jgi:hypothetical protein